MSIGFFVRWSGFLPKKRTDIGLEGKCLLKQKVLVTGSDGLIGSRLCVILEECGYAVRRFDIRGKGEAFGDICDRGVLMRAMDDCSGVIHLAAVSRVVWGEKDPQKCTETNVSGTANVIDCAQVHSRASWLVFGSSREVYGQSNQLPVTERSELQPMNHYARTKVAAEELVSKATDAGLVSSILRFSTVYGSVHDHNDRLVPAFCRAAIAGRNLRVDGKNNSLDITHVDDVCAAIVKVVEALASGRALPPMHFTSGTSTGLLSLAKLIIGLSLSESDIDFEAPRSFDVANFVGDSNLARREVGWEPKTRLEEGLEKLISELKGRGV